MGDHGNACRHDVVESLRVEVSHADVGDFTRLPQAIELERGLHVTGDVEIPPVELHEVEALHAEPLERAVDDVFDVAPVDCV